MTLPPRLAFSMNVTANITICDWEQLPSFGTLFRSLLVVCVDVKEALLNESNRNYEGITFPFFLRLTQWDLMAVIALLPLWILMKFRWVKGLANVSCSYQWYILILLKFASFFCSGLLLTSMLSKRISNCWTTTFTKPSCTLAVGRWLLMQFFQEMGALFMVSNIFGMVWKTCT